MPTYQYMHPETGEVVEVIQKMKDEHVYLDDEGVEWDRVFNVPNASFDTAHYINPDSKSDFMKATEKFGMTAGDMMDLSKELHHKREKIHGKDPVKDKAVTDYEKKTGKPHPQKSK